jgi:hypothetical protein
MSTLVTGHRGPCGEAMRRSCGQLSHNRLFTSAVLIVAVLAASGPPFGVSAASASARPTAGSSGSFTLSGSVTGTLKVPAHFAPESALAGCSTVNGTDTITWRNVKLNVGGTPKEVANVALAINAEFGQTQSIAPSTTASSTSVTFSTTYAYAWQGASGTATTTAAGKSGTLKGTLTGTQGHPGSVAITGSWAGCTKPASV